jgi:hypothetical protein
MCSLIASCSEFGLGCNGRSNPAVGKAADGDLPVCPKMPPVDVGGDDVPSDVGVSGFFEFAYYLGRGFPVG